MACEASVEDRVDERLVPELIAAVRAIKCVIGVDFALESVMCSVMARSGNGGLVVWRGDLDISNQTYIYAIPPSVRRQAFRLTR